MIFECVISKISLDVIRVYIDFERRYNLSKSRQTGNWTRLPMTLIINNEES